MEEYQRYTTSYRMIETKQVMSWIRAGQCGCIVGLRGSGKSNFIRYLLRVETQQHHLAQEQADCVFALINLLALTERTEWEIYETIVNNLLLQLRPPEIDNEIILEIKSLHQDVMRDHNILIAKRAAERCMALICQQPTRRLILLFDEFDAVFRELPASFFRCLRAIRDMHIDQISYVVVATHDLAELRNDLDEEVDQFYRLVSRNPCWLGPYVEADARQMAGYLAAKRALRLSEKDLKTLFDLSGGHAGFLKTILSLLWTESNTGKLEKSPDAIAREPVIERECQKLWGSLSEREKTSLCAIANSDPLDESALNHLAARGLLRPGRNNSRVISSPLLHLYAKKQAPPPQMGSYLNRAAHIIQLHGRRIQNLTELEFELAAYLYEKRGQLCTKEDILEQVYLQQSAAGLPDDTLHALVYRLRKKIEPDPQHPRYLLTVHGEGYKFVLPDEP